MKIRIGTRKSRLAIAQTKMAENALKKAFPEIETEIVHITTKGDKILDKPLNALGGKGVFTGEIERALLCGEIDMAVHSAKDLPVFLADGLEISAVLPRGNYRDVLVTLPDFSIDKSREMLIGTGSIRRREGFSPLYPNAVFGDIRGNVDTRIRKLKNGEFDGIILAAAGLERLGITEDSGLNFTYFDYMDFLPAPCQGIIAIECAKNSETAKTVQKITHFETELCFRAEREIIRLTGGDCSTPLGAYSFIRDGLINVYASKNTDRIISGQASAEKAEILARELVSQL